MRNRVVNESVGNTNKNDIVRLSIGGLVILSLKVRDKNSFIKNSVALTLVGTIFATGMGLAYRDQRALTEESKDSLEQKPQYEVFMNEAPVRNKRLLMANLGDIEFDFEEEKPTNDNSHYHRPVKRLPISYNNSFGETLDPNRELTREEKLALVMEYHSIESEFQYYQIVSVLANEGGPENYNECYDVLCAAYNRTLSKAWCNDCEKYNKNEDGTSKDPTLITSQLFWRSQFSGFLPNKAGKDREEYEGTKADEAALDFLYQAMLDGNAVRSHDYTSFNAPWYKDCPASAIQLNPECDGNCYFYKLKESDLNDKAIEIGVELGISR